jgi:hypothetical protein
MADETMSGGTKRNQKRSKHRSRGTKSKPWKIRVYDSSGEVDVSEKNTRVILSDGDVADKKGERAA